jgi:DNA polymerase-3 subunit gamma/tau
MTDSSVTSNAHNNRKGLGPSSVTASEASYRVLALETRPQSLCELVGQDTVRKVLTDMITSRRLPHALLLTGTRGTGKTSTARIFAKSLCCIQGPTVEPCGVCDHCVAITASAHEDVLEIDGASNTGVDQIRELRESARFYPKSARYKIFIIDEVHMLSVGAFNALLKTLEEPPAQVVFVLATTEVGKVPATVRSRCMVLPFRKADVATLAAHLGQVVRLRNIEADADALTLIAREGRGSFRDALSLLEQALPYADEKGCLSAAAVQGAFGLRDRECARTIFLAIAQRDVGKGLSAIDQADKLGFDFPRLMQQVSEYARFAVLLKIAEGSSMHALFDELLESERKEIVEAIATHSRTALAECFRVTQQSIQEMSRSAHPRPWAEIAFLDAAERSQWLESADLLAALTEKPTSTMDRSAPTPALESSPQLDLNKMRQWISLVSEHSVPLGAKLRHARFEAFSPQGVRLAHTPENALFGSITEAERNILESALKSLGWTDMRLEGFQSSSKPTAPQASVRSPGYAQGQRQELPNDPSKDQPRPQKPLKHVLDTGADPFAPPAQKRPASTRPPVAEDTKPKATPEPLSLSSVDADSAQRALDKKKERLLAHPFFVKLGAASAGLQISPGTSQNTEDTTQETR